jgi:serine/threonine protein kinase
MAMGRRRGLILGAVLAWAAAMAPLSTMAEQQYNSTDGYTCNGKDRTCNTYALYRTFQAEESLQKVGGYFNKTPASVANVSGMNTLATNAKLRQGQALYVPLDCSCKNVTQQMQVAHTIVFGDTFWLLSVTIYGGLTTYEAMEVLNPTKKVTNLTIGNTINVPIFCACPTAEQIAHGTNFLLTYTVYPDETLDVISGYFGITTAQLSAANQIASNTTLGVNTTLLIPLASLPPIATINFATVPPPPPVPVPPAPSPTASVVVSKPASKTPLYIGIAVGALGLTLAAVFGTLLLCKACQKQPRDESRKGVLYESHGYYQNAPSGSQEDPELAMKANAFHLEMLAGMSDMVGSEKPVLLSYQELQDATQDFSEESFVQGAVYRGRIRGQLVAIKQMKGNMSQELKILCQVHHSNLVKLVGLCIGGSEHLYLVYEYAENGSLNDCLRNQAAIGRERLTQSAAYLPWTARVRIALDVASGLEYIHNYTNPSFVHKDVKSSNILLDGAFRAKVANFGMAKSAATSGPLLTRHIAGTQGYMAPEYLEHGLVTVKADVFSYGVVLLEILSGKEAIVRPGPDAGEKERALSEIIHEILDASPDRQRAKLQSFMDPELHSAFPMDVASSVASLARMCVDADPAVRPSMKDVTFALSKMQAASQEWDATAAVYGSGIHSLPIEAR